ncbi:hypothetical protein RHGRI_028311 [Rhododendron griersonianum]|uniref:Uncharacterized protein n=1 Tax=Rhododendron griersonianum TaxID=479676 RepID=A0AAV6IFE7_9ERIC|nr:hypothetical protein RHGRI_028311 [Rhododendron griersonianum]
MHILHKQQMPLPNMASNGFKHRATSDSKWWILPSTSPNQKNTSPGVMERPHLGQNRLQLQLRRHQVQWGACLRNG